MARAGPRRIARYGEQRRRVLGWAYGKRKDLALTLTAPDRAVCTRKPARGLIFHTDRGIEYAAVAFKARLAELGITQSMNRPGKLTRQYPHRVVFPLHEDRHRAWPDLHPGARDPIGGAGLHSLLQRHSATLVVELRAASGVRETAGMTDLVSTKSGEILGWAAGSPGPRTLESY